MKLLDILNKRIDAVIQWILAIFGVVMLIVNLAQISGRYVFFHSIRWSEELSTFMYVWIIFLALHMITRERADLIIDVLNFKNERYQRILLVFRDVICMITVIILFVSSIFIIRNAIRFPRVTASLKITSAPLYFCMPISFTLVFLQRMTNMLHNIKDPLTRKED